ncbi:arsenic transporter [Pseudoneobacillus rhizosphaerae]|uniref:Arsenical pump membrane protein n=1 Tax=Pseudoneobacillus rhizosphaerae TaxID=2880968 RepID=A0A9C7L9S0_9BACI|nr:arsenic transporter [Pseudoneobacillus rhizosphaerae]CAG9607302.1 Arsenical pump membrane protein [Pseudoneobacillus rhizosphaerae]
MFQEYTVIMTIFAFFLTMVIIFIRPKEMNEAIPATIGAVIVFLSGSVSVADLIDISTKVSGAAITIMATIVMALVLESFRFFYWTALLLLKKSKGSGVRLFWLTLLLCFLMTLFFNNDGSILITTPILILILRHLGLKNHQKIPYLLSGALIATASSAPIGVSNIVNLIALKIVDMDLYLHSALMFVPGTLGLLFLAAALFFVFNKDIPKKIPLYSDSVPLQNLDRTHPLKGHSINHINTQNKLMIKILLFVFLIRASLFIASYFNISISLVAVVGSIILLVWRWFYLKISPKDMLTKTPWHILVFAFNMYVIIYGLHNIGLTQFLIKHTTILIEGSLLNASLTMGILIFVLSNLFNNHPALMIGTIALTEMGLDPVMLKTVYLANIIGSDIGSLILPIGTLASLIWMHILKKNKIKISWKKYIKTTLIVIPPTLIFTLFCLYYWLLLVYVH